MMIRAYQEGDLNALTVQHAQLGHESWLHPADDDLVFSGWQGGECVGVAGLSAKWPGTRVAYALFADGWQRHTLSIVRFVRYVIINDPTPRIEAYVISGDTGAGRFAEAVGFECEARGLRGFAPDGQAMDLYARVR
jgi:hypothetical protein